MSPDQFSPAGPRVVVLTRDAALLPTSQSICLGSAYEAAAELLSAPVAALVIDLDLLSAQHTRLISLARSLDVEMLAVGTPAPGLDSSQLSGVRLLSREELGHAVQRIVSGNGARLVPAKRHGSAIEAGEQPPRSSELLTSEELSWLLREGT